MGKRGLNTCTLAGSVGAVDIGTSKHGVPFVRFSLAIEDRRGEVTWVRATGYRGIHEVCMGRLTTGMFVVVRGSLISTGPSDNLKVEVVVDELIFAGGASPKQGCDSQDQTGCDDIGNRR